MRFEFTLSPQQQRGVALALTAIPVLALVAVLTSFIGGQIERHQQVALLVHKLARERAVLSQAPVWHERLSQIKSSPQWQSLFVAKTQVPGGAALTLIKSAGGKVEQSSTQRMEAAGAVEIDEYVVFAASTEQLSHILQSLRGLSPVFVVRAISVHSPDKPEQPIASGPNMLRIALTIAEFERPS